MTVAPEAVTLADRMRGYEQVTRMILPTRTYTVIRVDGKAFHTYTRGLADPYDEQFIAAMDATATAMVQQVSNTVAAYVQSDEISLITTDLSGSRTEPWLGGVVAKIVSLSAAIATAAFNAHHTHPDGHGPALFDSRVFTIDDPSEVTGYLTWRQRDAYRNAINMICDTHLRKKATIGIPTPERVQALAAAGVNLDSFPAGFLHGRFLQPVETEECVTYTHKGTGERITVDGVKRRRWVCEPAPNLNRWRPPYAAKN